MWFKKNKWKLILPAFAVAALAAAFYLGGGAPDARGWDVPTPPGSSAERSTPAAAPEKAETTKPAETAVPAEQGEEAAGSSSPAQSSAPEPPATPLPEPSVTSAPEPPPAPAQKPASGQPACTISISCETILANMELCDSEKAELVPESGGILAPLTVTFTQGESVFDVLKRVCRDNGIHLEFVETPAYNSVYVEGIHNLYEFDVGELSGWMYQVNGVFPNFSCSLYTPADGDVIRWVYTCDQGADVGGGTA